MTFITSTAQAGLSVYLANLDHEPRRRHKEDEVQDQASQAPSSPLGIDPSLTRERSNDMNLPITSQQRAELADNELMRIAIDSFLRLRKQEGNNEVDPAAMAEMINEETGVGRRFARLAAFSVPV
jgi:hypothetical protein